MSPRAAGKSFRQVHLAHTDDFGAKNDKIRLWVINNGGTFSREVKDGVTHLVCSKKAWNDNRDIVRDAQRRRIKVVALDWLEESLLSSSRRPKAERKFEWDSISRKKHGTQKRKRARNDQVVKSSIAAFDKDCLDFEATMNTTGYHVYSDPTGFSYSVILARTFILENQLEKFTLKVRYPCRSNSSGAPTSSHPCPLHIYLFPAFAGFSYHPVIRCKDHYPSQPEVRVPIPRPWAQSLQLYESDAIPHTFACYVKYTRRGTSGREVLAIPGSNWDLAFDGFRKFFKTKTGKDWNNRLDRKAALASGKGKTDEFFRYEPPSDTQVPKGLVEKKTIRERIQEAKSGGDKIVTMVIPTVIISDDDDDDDDRFESDRQAHLTARANTPEGNAW